MFCIDTFPQNCERLLGGYKHILEQRKLEIIRIKNKLLEKGHFCGKSWNVSRTGQNIRTIDT